MGKRSTSRKLAMQALYEFEIRAKDEQEIIKCTLNKDSYIEETKKFCSEIFWGVLENQNFIDSLIKKHAIDWKFERIAGIDKVILRVGIWELILTETSTKIIISEMIELIRKYSMFEAIKFVNGLLGVVAVKRKELTKKCLPE